MEKIENLIINNDFINLRESILIFEHNEDELRITLSPLADEYGLIIISILTEIAYLRSNAFWFNQIGYFLSFNFSHIDGAGRMALSMFKKSFEIDPNDNLTIKAILDFRDPPEIILTDIEYNYYSKFLSN